MERDTRVFTVSLAGLLYPHLPAGAKLLKFNTIKNLYVLDGSKGAESNQYNTLPSVHIRAYTSGETNGSPRTVSMAIHLQMKDAKHIRQPPSTYSYRLGASLPPSLRESSDHCILNRDFVFRYGSSQSQ